MCRISRNLLGRRSLEEQNRLFIINSACIFHKHLLMKERRHQRAIRSAYRNRHVPVLSRTRSVGPADAFAHEWSSVHAPGLL